MSDDEGTVYGIRPHRPMTEQQVATAMRLSRESMRLTLERANKIRAEVGLPPLTELPNRGGQP
ncbi:hypothetical protein [Nocardia farcinica]|uniref:hypothetical protein n=1 Tax=Nocardia farcinica TaxID=37329 RepID=UPI00245508C9|nr:hypothetical protein [Nocardia farcinica]